jgi:MFS superfamily sulfate permease-like transporter
MFTDDNESCEPDVDLPPIPKYVILDMSIVTGIDTSAVDVMAEISTLCKVNQCCLILSGIPPTVKPPLIAGGLTPSRLNPHLFFMDDLDVSLGKAEDDLLKLVARNEERLIQEGKKQKHQRITSMIDHGLRYALRKIDEEHDVSFATKLSELENYAVARELEVGELLNEVGSDCLPRGLYFIESGLIKCVKS